MTVVRGAFYASLEVVLLEVAHAPEEGVLRLADAAGLHLVVDQLERAEQVCRLEQVVAGGPHLAYLGVDQRVEDGVDYRHHLFLAIVVVHDDVVEGLEELEVVAHEQAQVADHSPHQCVVVGALALHEHERLVADVRDAGEVEEVAEEPAAVRQLEILVLALAPDQRAGVDRMVGGEAALDHLALQVLDGNGNVLRLVVQNKRDEVNGSVRLVGPEVARFVDEDTQL